MKRDVITNKFPTSVCVKDFLLSQILTILSATCEVIHSESSFKKIEKTHVSDGHPSGAIAALLWRTWVYHPEVPFNTFKRNHVLRIITGTI